MSTKPALETSGGLTLIQNIAKLTKNCIKQKKPYSAVTVKIEDLTGERYEEDDVGGIPELVEVIRLQGTGPTEAARALRKKLKYGNAHQQIRALVILDGLIQNAGPNFQRTFADEMLRERLSILAHSDNDQSVDPLVKKKCRELFRSWAAEYKNTPGLGDIAKLYKQMPRQSKVVTKERSKVLRETEENPFEVDEDKEEEEVPPSTAPVTSHSRKPSVAQSSRSSTSGTSTFFGSSKTKKDKKGSKRKTKAFNLEAEKGNMKNCIAEASFASTNLLNALKLINREREQVSDNENAVREFEQCKTLRRQTLGYIQLVTAEKWLGALLNANDQLITALLTFEQLDRSIDADSDSDDEMAEQAHLSKMSAEQNKGKETAKNFAGLNLGGTSNPPGQGPPQPPRPVQPPPQEKDESEDEDESDPFADRNEVNTPMVEKEELRWRVV